MAITLTSTLQDVLTQFVVLDANHDPATATVQTDDTTIELFWPDASRVRLDISVGDSPDQGVSMAPAGTNPPA